MRAREVNKLRCGRDTLKLRDWVDKFELLGDLNFVDFDHLLPPE